MDLPALHPVLLPKIPSLGLQNALSTIMVFHAALLLIKELTLQPKKYDKGPVRRELAVLTTLFTILKELV